MTDPAGRGETPKKTVLVVTRNLMDRTRIEASVRQAGAVTRAVDAVVADASADGAVVVVDLAHPGSLDVIRGAHEQGMRTIGYGSHVDRDGLRAAADAGCDRVFARSAFFAGLPSVVTDSSRST